MTEKKTRRIASIDVFRAITMFLMIFVNDLPSVQYPKWLGHADAVEDYFGFSDIIFPAFLFILGMAIPLAIRRRLLLGDDNWRILKHIAIRSFALLVLGVFSVNMGSLSPDYFLSKPIFTLVWVIAVFLTWNLYPRTENKNTKKLYRILTLLGWFILALLAITYRNTEGEIMQTSWWGILGLIGWTYAICATIYLYCRKNIKLLVAFTLAFLVLCMAANSFHLGVFHKLLPGNGCFHAFAMLGLLLTLLYQETEDKLSETKKIAITAVTGVLILAAAGVSHQFWIVNKIQATPTWLLLCAGISIVFYLMLYWICDMMGKTKWFDSIKTAGTSTLTCYILPSALYAIFSLMPFSILHPDMKMGLLAIIKCLAFSAMTIWIVTQLGKIKIRLKL